MTAEKTPKYKLPRGHALMVRTCDAECRSTHEFAGRFRWPRPDEDLGHGPGVAVAPDWDPTARCGGGLHGALWGVGDASLLQWGEGPVGLVVEVLAKDVVDLGGKVKVPRGRVVFAGLVADAVAWMHGYTPKTLLSAAFHATIANAGTRGAASSTGYGGAASSTGYGGAASSTGYGGAVRAGKDGCLSAVYWDGSQQRYRWCIGRVGEDADGAGALIEPYVWYMAEPAGFRRATDPELRERNVDPQTQGVRPEPEAA
jgi:hypothetical protein